MWTLNPNLIWAQFLLSIIFVSADKISPKSTNIFQINFSDFISKISSLNIMLYIYRWLFIEPFEILNMWQKYIKYIIFSVLSCVSMSHLIFARNKINFVCRNNETFEMMTHFVFYIQNTLWGFCFKYLCDVIDFFDISRINLLLVITHRSWFQFFGKFLNASEVFDLIQLNFGNFQVQSTFYWASIFWRLLKRFKNNL